MINILNFFFRVDDDRIYKIMGKRMYVRNGVGFNWVSDDFLFNNCFLQLGFGYIRSGYGDWGGGAGYAVDYALKVTIDKNFIIRDVKTYSFYNSESSQQMEKKAVKIAKRLKVGTKFIIKDKKIVSKLAEVFALLPVKEHVGYDFHEHFHMFDYFISNAKKRKETEVAFNAEIASKTDI